MDNAGTYTLAALPIGRSLDVILSPITGLDGMTAVTIEASFLYGSGGSSCSATIMTSFDGEEWRDVARFDFGTASAVKSCNVVTQAPLGVITYQDLSSEGVSSNPIFGDRITVFVESIGTYVNSTLCVRAAVRDGRYQNRFITFDFAPGWSLSA